MKLSLRMKLTLLVAFPLLCFALASLYLLSEEKEVFEELSSSIYETSNQVSMLVLNADRDMYQSYSAYLQLESGVLNKTQFETAKKEMKANQEQAVERVAAAREILESAELLDLAYGQSGLTTGQIFDLFDKNYAYWFQIAAVAVEDGKPVPFNLEIDLEFQISREGIDEVGESIDKHAKLTIDSIEEHLKKSQLTILIVIITVAISLTILVTIMIVRLMKTIKTVMDKTRRVSEGDLTIARDTRYDKDELGQISRSVDDMIENMNGLITAVLSNTMQVSQSSEHLSTVSKESAAASEHVAVHIQEVANGSQIQARGAEETSRAIEEMTIGIGRIAENTLAISDHSLVTSSQAEEGQVALDRLEGQMEEVKIVIEKLSSTIATLERRSGQIGAIAENITTFSNQTNILSLNAAIEAARAGEHGRGFAVVASEIRKLAAGSLESAENINQLVEVTKNEIAGAASFMSQTMQEVERGSERVRDVSNKLDVISVSVSQMTQQLQENSAVTEQMSASSEEVSASMEQSASTAISNLENTESVAAATEEQLALMESISAASQHLNEIVHELNGTVAHFKVKK
ncbi:HAMP domain-containing protein [Paenibacillus sp. GSMTC-2017]|uniref:methyl-accepting chemotaxis protein n=1 Tax=Paenibacillus sp. GSMTC-2017 TaxID=2794350 RepID=UPI0018D65049|nr:methyl-accepting chemotaxis protein [Paenibacillus sp. GSMTC-2017]MBH5316871.1 HAMP domain-containing protein [Paenibacillus sp. GSMTC-2017]